MKKYIGTVILLGIAFAIGTVLPQLCQDVWGQGGYPAVPQVVLQQPAEQPKWFVDIAPFDDPANPMRKMRVITVVETEAKKIAVYHEEVATGKIFLMSVRDIQPDLMINQYNAMPPLPSELGKEIQRLKN